MVWVPRFNTPPSATLFEINVEEPRASGQNDKVTPVAEDGTGQQRGRTFYPREIKRRFVCRVV